MTLAAAIGVGLVTAATTPRWDPGDLLVGAYLAAVSLVLWVHGARIKVARPSPPFTPIVALALATALSVGVALAVADIATHGSL